MAKQFEFSVVAKFRDLAMRDIRRFQARLRSGWSAGAGGGFARMFGGGVGGRLAQRLAARPSGVGGIFSDVLQGATALTLLPVRIIGAFTRLIPGIGGVLSGVVGTAANVLQGIVGVAANVVGGIINAFGKLIQGIATVFERVVGVVARGLGRITKIAGMVAAGTGAVFAWQFIKGIRENMQLADLRQVLRKLLGEGMAKEVERFARKLSLVTPFTPFEMIQASLGVGAVGRDPRKYLTLLADWAAGAKKPLDQVIETFQRVVTGAPGARRGIQRLLISIRDLQREGATFTKAGAFTGTPEEMTAYMMRAVERRFGGMAKAAATVGSGPWSTFVGAVQDLRISLTQPWYERFNDGLIDINESLLALAESPAWQKVIEWSDKAAEAADSAIRDAIDIMTDAGKWADFKRRLGERMSVAWEGAVERAKIALGGITDLFAVKEGGEWGLGPLTNWIVVAFDMAITQVGGLFQKLWIDVGQDLQNRLLGAVANVANAINAELMGRHERMAQEDYEKERSRYLKWGFPGAPARWEDLPHKDREWRIEQQRIPLVEKQLQQVLSFLQELVAGAQRIKMPAEKEAAKEAVDERTRRAMEEGGGRLAGYAEDMREGAAATRGAWDSVPMTPEGRALAEATADLEKVRENIDAFIELQDRNTASFLTVVHALVDDTDTLKRKHQDYVRGVMDLRQRVKRLSVQPY